MQPVLICDIMENILLWKGRVMKKYRCKKTISTMLVFLWVGLIFSFSSQEAEQSAELSMGLLQGILKILEGLPLPQELNAFDWHWMIRKSAHFAEYFILGFLGLNALGYWDNSRKRKLLLTLGFSLLVAGCDEYYQTFVPGRSGQGMDVLIDGIGSTFGLLFYSLYDFLKKRKSIPEKRLV
ncbi:MAG TPA: VanZ family protein [Eubacteriaceae bacterium]|nr:VanZ family protein [Eubacteriaceae bacterium]